jgi:branched-chain amino acid transport system permease protein
MLGEMSSIAFVILYGVSYGLVLALIAIGLVVTMGLMRVTNLAHGAFAAIGGYLSTGLMVKGGMPFPLAVLAASLVVALFSIAVERAFYVYLYTAPELEQVLLTIGLDFIAIGALTFFYGPNVYPTPLPSYLAANVDLGIQSIQLYRLAVVAVSLLIIAALWYMFDRTTLGAQIRAAVDNRTMAQSTGINVSRLFSLVFALGSGLAALGGALGAPMLPLEPLYPFKYLILVLIVVALSGFGNVKSVVGVALLVGIVETAGRLLFPSLSGFMIYLLLIILMIWRPDGLFATRRAQ